MSNEIVLIAFYFSILLYSIILHEVSHGFVALWLGDLTAKYEGRLSLNPISHIDPVGSILIPLLLIPTGFAFGYAKPVPYNPYNLRDQKWGPLMVALAGPFSNFLIAGVAAVMAAVLPLSSIAKIDILNRFSIVIRGGDGFFERFGFLADAMVGSLPGITFGLLLFVIFWNIVLGCFNLLPFPPLDGSKLLFTLFPIKEKTQFFFQQYGFFFLILLLIFPPTSHLISVIIGFFLNLFLGFTH